MMQDDISFRDSFCWEDSGLPLRNMQLIKELRVFEKSIQEGLARIKKEPTPNKELIKQEKTILEATQREIQRLEKQSLYSQLDPH